jgi:hypothetical protein
LKRACEEKTSFYSASAQVVGAVLFLQGVILCGKQILPEQTDSFHFIEIRIIKENEP